MKNRRLFFIAFVLLISLTSIASKCRRQNGEFFTIALDGRFSTLDPIGSVTVDANSERLRTLKYN